MEKVIGFHRLTKDSQHGVMYYDFDSTHREGKLDRLLLNGPGIWLFCLTGSKPIKGHLAFFHAFDTLEHRAFVGLSSEPRDWN
jgi:hypothetical protein